MTEVKHPRLKRDWIGRYVRLKNEIVCEDGVRFAPGEIMHVYSYYHGLSLESIRHCPECKRKHREKITRVSIKDVELLPEDYEPVPLISTLAVQGYILSRGRPDHWPDIYVTLDRVEQCTGADKWAVRRGGWCLDKDGDFVLEPIPSSRTPEFLEAARWDTPQEAYQAWIDAGRPLK